MLLMRSCLGLVLFVKVDQSNHSVAGTLVAASDAPVEKSDYLKLKLEVAMDVVTLTTFRQMHVVKSRVQACFYRTRISSSPPKYQMSTSVESKPVQSIRDRSHEKHILSGANWNGPVKHIPPDDLVRMMQ